MSVRARFALRVVERGWNKIRKFVDAAAERESFVKVGYLDDGGKGSEKRGELSQAAIGAVMEFGTEDKKIPARPHVRPTFDQKREELGRDAAVLVGKILDGKMTVARALGILGAKLASEIKKRVTTGDPIPPPNSPEVAARKKSLTRPGSKGSVRTLIDTGRLIVSITWAVVLAPRRGR